MKSLRIITKDFDIFDKFSKLNILNSIEFDNTPYNRMKLNRIINNINAKESNVNVNVIDDIIRISKKKCFNINIYLK